MSASPETNWLLCALPPEERQRIALNLELIEISVRTVITEPNQPAEYVFFPESAVLSVVSHLSDGAVEVGTVGSEGMAGLPIFLDAEVEPLQVICQIPGTAWRMEVGAFREIVEEPSALRRLLLRYTQAFLIQVAQTAACNGTHSLEERCARWLLMTHDRVGDAEFELTHQFLAFMLGVRRAGVTVAMRALQKRGVLTYSRGHVTVLDRKGLEAKSCECYGVVRSHYERLLSTPNTDQGNAAD
ncbi:MAG: Crp/Fnr family transcriptional regulator [bacterium]